MAVKGVLVIDDEPQIVEIFKHILVNKKKYKLFTDNNLATAEELIVKERIDLLICDANLMGGIVQNASSEIHEATGIAFSEKIKSQYPHIKVIIISGHTALLQKRKIKVDECIKKPFHITSMKMLINYYLFGPINFLFKRLETWKHKDELKVLNRQVFNNVEAIEQRTWDGLDVKSEVYHLKEQKRASCSLGVSVSKGCPVMCQDCLSHEDGFVRKLSMAEILCQTYHNLNSTLVDNLLRNFQVFEMYINSTCGGDAIVSGPQETIAAFKEVVDIPGLRIKPIITTVGTEDGFRDFYRNYLDVLPELQFYLSLDFLNPEKRAYLKPGVAKESIQEIAKILLAIYHANKVRHSLSWVLRKGQNDSLNDARQLAEFAKKYKFKVKVQNFNTNKVLSKLDEIERDRQVKLFTKAVNGFGADCRWRIVSEGAPYCSSCGTNRVK